MVIAVGRDFFQIVGERDEEMVGGREGGRRRAACCQLYYICFKLSPSNMIYFFQKLGGHRRPLPGPPLNLVGNGGSA